MDDTRGPWILVDRDGTLIEDSPPNGDAGAVVVLPSVAEGIAELRAAGASIGVLTNQPVLGRGEVTREQFAAVNARIESLLGEFDPWMVCPHDARDDCLCRKPQPGLIVRAAQLWGVPPWYLTVIGDTAADVRAAAAVGARAVLVPNDMTDPADVDGAPLVAKDFASAVHLVLTIDRATRGIAEFSAVAP